MAKKSKEHILPCGCTIWTDEPQPMLKYCDVHSIAPEALKLLKETSRYMGAGRDITKIEIEEIPVDYLTRLNKLIARTKN